jgi:hypothetical protein
MSVQIANLWDVEVRAGEPGVWLREYPFGHGARMSADGARELAEALLAAADEADTAASTREQGPAAAGQNHAPEDNAR